MVCASCSPVPMETKTQRSVGHRSKVCGLTNRQKLFEADITQGFALRTGMSSASPANALRAPAASFSHANDQRPLPLLPSWDVTHPSPRQAPAPPLIVTNPPPSASSKPASNPSPGAALPSGCVTVTAGSSSLTEISEVEAPPEYSP